MLTIYPCRTICGNGFLDIEEECERRDVAETKDYVAKDMCLDHTKTGNFFYAEN